MLSGAFFDDLFKAFHRAHPFYGGKRGTHLSGSFFRILTLFLQTRFCSLTSGFLYSFSPGTLCVMMRNSENGIHAFSSSRNLCNKHRFRETFWAARQRKNAPARFQKMKVSGCAYSLISGIPRIPVRQVSESSF